MARLDPKREATTARLDAHFDAALALDPESRRRYLERLHDADPGLAGALAALLDAAARPDSPLDHRPELRLEPSFAKRYVGGDRIGPYTLVRPLGAGGMGEVWLAEAEHGPSPVAIKRISAALKPELLAERLEREGELLRRLRHPGIAALLDSGRSADGEPYLVLEYVDGIPLLAAARERRWGVREKVAALRAIAEAVAAAQAQLVVHRDLKPANILVDRQGRPKLLDFGIAKLLDERGQGSSTQLTRDLGRLLTPAYAAPEQLAGEPVSTATDVYALGVVLHELLLGLKPERRRQDGELRPPSQRARRECRDRALARVLAGDLDALLAKALATAPNERYTNAQALADDLCAWLEQRPLRARPAGPWTQVGKWILRHRLAAAALTLALLAILGGSTIAWQRSIVAEREAARAEYVRAFLERLFGNDLPGVAREELPTTAELLQRGIEQALADRQAEPGARLGLLTSLAEILIGQRLWTQAEQALTAALDLAPAVPDLPAWRRPALEADLAAVRTYLNPEDRDRGLHALVAAQRRAADLGAPPKWRAGALSALIRTEVEIGLAAEARAHADELLALIAAHPGLGAEIELMALNQAVTAYGVDQVYRPQAEAWARQAKALALQHFGERHAETAYATMRLAGTLRMKGEAEEALREAEAAVRTAEAVYPKDHPQQIRILTEYARVLVRLDRLEDGAAVWQRVLAAQLQNPDQEMIAARTQVFLGQLLLRLDRTAEAETHLRAALPVLQRHLGEEFPLSMTGLKLLGQIHFEAGRSDELEALLPSLERWFVPETFDPSDWRRIDLILLRLQLDAEPVRRSTARFLLDALLGHGERPAEVSSALLELAQVLLAWGWHDWAREALAGVDARAVPEKLLPRSDIKDLLRLLLAVEGSDPTAVAAARQRVIERRGRSHPLVRYTDQWLAERQDGSGTER